MNLRTKKEKVWGHLFLANIFINLRGEMKVKPKQPEIHFMWKQLLGFLTSLYCI
ncbi:hypothetical protein HMPREF0519_1582 [Lentilactobacillus hilgardii DSM 20176 = ATCC 8290]|uniref:Uncharacterized protein n=1 Tax=Lentilactobacillus hilgardii (strain ATCC 8290 / DSM 20176 / CCUG 30140 / JCM 1155 / KCTC 3500 / NBRC 15886 / NCIMB 8040 / NRRL B-1843 / 9) TaxID=1423757 RepID=C0XK21_LENH9|nr:hypothetical protein HMPREF0519_1582 [Lentilactobacillus hilgardii DSM 20176 = ATCC 8290]